MGMGMERGRGGGEGGGVEHGRGWAPCQIAWVPVVIVGAELDG